VLGRFDEAVVAATFIERNPGESTAYREMGLNELHLGATSQAAERQGLGSTLMQLGQDAGQHQSCE
jgi:hypothetical protein